VGERKGSARERRMSTLAVAVSVASLGAFANNCGFGQEGGRDGSDARRAGERDEGKAEVIRAK
jgi:hypothetical protein